MVGAVFLVAALSLAFAVGSGQHVTTLGLYVVGALFVSAAIALFRASYEQLTGEILRAAGVRRRAVLVGTAAQRDRLGSGLGAAQAGIEDEFVGELNPDASDDAIFAVDDLDDVIVADMGISEERCWRSLTCAQAGSQGAHRTAHDGAARRAGEYVPGLGVPLFELRPPIFAGADWTLKRSFDLVVSALIVVVGLPVWVVIAAAIKLTSRGPVFYADPRVGLGEQEFRMLKFRTMVADADRQQERSSVRTKRRCAVQDPPRSACHLGRPRAPEVVARRGAAT